MRPFTNNKGTSSAIFYNRGVPKSDKMFAYLATQNYTVLKQLAIYNRNNSQNISNRSSVSFSR